MKTKPLQIGIQTRLSILLIFTATLIFSVFAFYNYITLRTAMTSELHGLTNFWAKQLSESVKMPVWDYSDESLAGIVNSTMLEKQVYAVVVRNDKGKVLYGRMRDSNWDITGIGQEISGNEYSDKQDILQKGEKIGTLEVRLSPRFMQKKLRDETFKMFITIIILNIALIFSLFIGSRRLIILPVSRIVKSVRVIASGEWDTPVPNGRNDEIGQLASDVESMRLAIKNLTENLKEQERLKNEMELAKKIQTCLLPKKPEISGYEIAASCEPADEVGGDYYDVISVGGYDWIVIGDVSGHGVTSGLVMMMVQTAIHTVLIQNPEVPTSRLLSVINRTIYENIVRMDEQKHMTILVIACGRDGFFDFSGLHEDILFWCADSEKVEKIATDGMWIGLEPDISKMLPMNEFRMETDDCIVLYTDGIIEARSTEDGSFFGEERLEKIISSCGGCSAAEIHAAVLEALKEYEKPDDVTLFVMKRV